MQRDLNAILGHIAQLNELDTDGVPPMAQVGEILGGASGMVKALRCERTGAAFAGSGCGDGCGTGDRRPVLQGSQGD